MLDLVGGDGLEEEAGVELPPGEGDPNVVHRADTRLPGEDPRDVDVLQVEHRGHQRLLVQLGHGGPVHNNILLQLCTQQSFMMF